jgi:hypothetical protein
MVKQLDNEKGSIEEINYTIKDLVIDEIIPNVIDNFMVTIFEDHHTIVIPPTITGIQLKAWSRGRGGIFSKDILNYTLGQKYGQYVLIKGDKIYCIARLILEEEIPTFNTFKLIDGQIKDVSYMILRNLKEDDRLINTQKLIIEKDVYTEVDPMILIIPKITHDDDPDYHVSSVSLFTE